MTANTPRKSLLARRALVTGGTATGLLIAAGVASTYENTASTDTVRLTAETDGPATIRLDDGQGGRHTIDMDHTWELDVPAAEADDLRFSVSPAYMSTTTSVTCHIYSGDRLVDEAHGTGRSGAARCTA